MCATASSSRGARSVARYLCVFVPVEDGGARPAPRLVPPAYVLRLEHRLSPSRVHEHGGHQRFEKHGAAWYQVRFKGPRGPRTKGKQGKRGKHGAHGKQRERKEIRQRRKRKKRKKGKIRRERKKRRNRRGTRARSHSGLLWRQLSLLASAMGMSCTAATVTSCDAWRYLKRAARAQARNGPSSSPAC